jgi:ABC-type glycerol-3-phosphate transport system substrate-binding protein
MKRLLGFMAMLFVALFIGGSPLRAAAPTKVTFWHYVSAPQPSKELEAQVAAFNASQAKFVVEASPVGTYQDLNIKLVAALRPITRQPWRWSITFFSPNWHKEINSRT